MNKKIGQLIKERVNAQNWQITTFAKEINVERSNVYDIFKRDSIDTKLLKKIGQVLKYDFFQDLLEPETIKEIILKERIDNNVFVSIRLSDEEIEKLGIKDKVLNELK
ncbi:MAG: hypothetical protein PHH23_06745 [Paludibacteraceae bacterium]|nr:hypothetical protein [Paludibacteraceae bacterium]